MRKSLNHIVVLFVFMFGHCINGQTGNALIKKICDRYANPAPFQFNTEYRLYKDHKTKDVNEFYTGIYLKNNNSEIYAKINNTEYFVINDLITQIDHSEKVMLISTNNSSPRAEFDINILLEDFVVSKVTDMKKYWKLELETKNITSYPYSKIIIEAGKDYYIKKQVFYYNSGVNFSTDYAVPDIKYPRLEITYSKPPKPISKSFKQDSYCLINKKGISASKAFKSYEIIDNRKTN